MSRQYLHLVHCFLGQTGCWIARQESRAVAGKPRDAAVIFQDGGRLYPGFSRTLKSQSAESENPTLESNISGSNHPLRRYGDLKFDIAKGVFRTHFEGRGGHGGSPIVPLQRAILVSYTLPIVTIALSLQ